jgi:hypothetical protein
MTLSRSELRLVGVEAVRALRVQRLLVDGGRTTFAVDFDGRPSNCSLEPAPRGLTFTCFDEPAPFKLRELQPASDSTEIAALEQQIKALTLPPEICDQAERCCKAIWPLLVPGEECDVGFQLGGRFPDTCREALRGFRLVSEAKHLPLPSSCQ